MKPLVIGNLKARKPIFQGEMGIGVSRWRLAGNVLAWQALILAELMFTDIVQSLIYKVINIFNIYE